MGIKHSYTILVYVFRNNFYFFKGALQHHKHKKHTRNTMELLGKQFWKNWRVTRLATSVGQPGDCPRLRDFTLKMCFPCSYFAKGLFQL